MNAESISALPCFAHLGREAKLVPGWNLYTSWERVVPRLRSAGKTYVKEKFLEPSSPYSCEEGRVVRQYVPYTSANDCAKSWLVNADDTVRLVQPETIYRYEDTSNLFNVRGVSMAHVHVSHDNRNASSIDQLRRYE